MVLIPRPPILMPDTRWLLHAAAEEETAAPEGRGNTKGGTQADIGILMGLSLGSPCPLLWPRCPHPPGSSSGAPFITPHSWEGGTWGIEWASKGEREVIVGSVKKALSAVGWWAGTLIVRERLKPGASLLPTWPHSPEGQGPFHGPTTRDPGKSWGREGSPGAP